MFTKTLTTLKPYTFGNYSRYMSTLILGKREFGGASTGNIKAVNLVLEYTKLPYKEKLYTDAKQWYEGDKSKFGLDFPNLPYILDGDVKLTETHAIIMYICDKAGRSDMLGKNRSDVYKIAMLHGVIKDVQNAVYQVNANGGEETLKNEKLKDIMPKLKSLSQFLGNKEYLMGYVTALDFGFYAIAGIMNEHMKGVLESFENLGAWKKRIDNIPEIKEYAQRSKKQKSIHEAESVNPERGDCHVGQRQRKNIN